MLDAARATCDYYIESAACADGIPYWDTGAPGLASLGDWSGRPADPFNDREPVDSSAAAIAAQGLLRLGRVLQARGEDGSRYEQAGLRVLDTLFDDAGPYLSVKPDHQGLILHSVYHWPNGWDHVPAGARTPRGESSQWGDYHAREAALYVKRLASGEPYLTFFGPRINTGHGATRFNTELE
jgi:unsaturated chondroitin disaccharide hydrolase